MKGSEPRGIHFPWDLVIDGINMDGKTSPKVSVAKNLAYMQVNPNKFEGQGSHIATPQKMTKGGKTGNMR